MSQERNIVVSGGGTGIGYAVAAAFAAAGDRVTITGRREATLRAAAARLGAGYAAFDASDPAQVTGALGELPERVDVLVNNAGGNTGFRGDGAAPADLAGLAESWRANLEANVLTAVLLTEALRDRLADHARVVNLGSIAASTGAGSYAAAKAAVEIWTIGLAGELGPRGITANVVAPGLIEDTEFFGDHLSQERRKALVEGTKNKRAGTPADVAGLITFLAGPDAGHITGQVLHVNGGAFAGR